MQPAGASPLSFTYGIYTFPGTVGTFVASVNKAGLTVGGYGPNLNTGVVSNYGFLLEGGKFTTIAYPGAAWTQPNAINDDGVIVGGYGHILEEEHGFKLTSGNTPPTSFDYPGAVRTFPFGINNAGDIVGTWWDATTQHGFLLHKGVFTSIDFPGAAQTIAYGINTAGEIVGEYGDDEYINTHGFLYSNGQFTTMDYPGGYIGNYAGDINDSGQIIGGYGNVVVNGTTYLYEGAYIYQNGTFTTLEIPFGPPAGSELWQLNNEGVITGLYADNSSTLYGFEATVGP